MRLHSIASERSGRIALGVVLVLAFPVLLWFGEGQWFFLDEWSFLANRKLPSVDGLFGDHNGHWVTIPLVIYRATFELFGLHTYVPYQVLVIASHLTIAALSHTVMRRAGVHSWLATGMILGFVFYGIGWGNILVAFQISLNGSVIAGLVQFLLADRDGPWSRRDTIGVGIAVLGLMTSAVMPAMSVAVGAFALVRRGWRVAAGHTIPPAIVFVIWFVGFGGSEDSDPHPWRIAQFMFHMIRGTFEGFGRSAPAGAALALVAAVGLGSAYTAWRRADDVRPFAIGLGLVTGVLAFAALTGYNRSGFGVDIAQVAVQGRYLHVCAALLIPLVALGAHQLWQWRRPLVLVPLVCVALGLPDNVDDLRNRNPFTTGARDVVLAVAHSELLEQVPGDFEPLAFQEIRAAWLLQAVEDGDIPDVPADLPIGVRLGADAALAFRVTATVDPPACEPVPGTIATTLQRGDTVQVGGPAVLQLTEGEHRSAPLNLGAGSTVIVQAGPVEVLVSGVDGEPTVCVASS